MKTPTVTSGPNEIALPASAWTAFALMLGIYAGSLPGWYPEIALLLTGTVLTLAMLLHCWKCDRMASVLTLCAVAMLGVTRHQLVSPFPHAPALRDLCRNSAPIVRLQGVVSSIPTVHVRPDSPTAPRMFGDPQQTRFQLRVLQVSSLGHDVPVDATCMVYAEGDASGIITHGDTVKVIGKLDWPDAPGNPGEFNFARFLQHRNISGLIYVSHARAIHVVQPASWWHFGRWTTRLQGRMRTSLQQLPMNVRAVAMALLLGDRNELPLQVENAFIASGTMHLLAISGLHVGILCLFVLRILNLILVPRRHALLWTLAFCIVYAVITDLRPSVVRATLFFFVFTVGQFVRRSHGMASLLSITALIMLAWQPTLIYDTGAWLSFLSVAALGWVSWQTADDSGEDVVPLDALTTSDRLRQWATTALASLGLRFRQTVSILLLTTPLVAQTFHVLSPVGLIANILLIPLTAVVLCCGFVFITVAILLPAAAPLPALVFSGMVTCLVKLVEISANLPIGHVYIADLPSWFVPAWYAFLLAMLLLRNQTTHRWCAGVGLAICGICGLLSAVTPPSTGEVRCTVLSVGHGSAAVIETGDGRTFLVDAGAMNQNERAAQAVCGFLRSSGYCQLDAILISHADMDHYNAMDGILAQVPVRKIYVSADFLDSEADSARAVLQIASDRGIPIAVARSGDVLLEGLSTSDVPLLSVLQPDTHQLPESADDNQKSLVVILNCAGRRIVLPGDLEGAGAAQILPQLGPADVLVSPHHGSLNANTVRLAENLKPKWVIVSSRDDNAAEQLSRIFSNADLLLFTSKVGAVTTTIQPAGAITVTSFRANETTPGNDH